MRRLWKIISILIILTGALVISGVVVLKSIDFSQYKNVIAQEVEKITGRKLSINGEFKLDIGLDTVLAVENVRFANAPWGSRRDMVQLESLKIDVKLLPLITGDIQVERLIMTGLDVFMETDKQGAANWELATAQNAQKKKSPSASSSTASSTASSIPVIKEIDIKKLKFTFRDGQSGKTTKALIDELTLAGEDNASPLNFALSARLDGMEYHAAGSLGSIDTLLSGDKPFAVNVQGNVAGVQISLKGNIDQPRKMEGLDINVSVFGKKLEGTIQNVKVYVPALKKIAVPPIGPFRVAGRLRGSIDKLGLSRLDAVIGDEKMLYLKLNGNVANLNQVAGIDLQVATSGEELADTVKLVEPYIPQLKSNTIPKVGPFTVAARVKGSLKALAVSGIDIKFGRPYTLLFSAQGGVADALSGQGINLTVGLEGQTLSSLEALTGSSFPKIPPFSITARVSDKAGYTIRNLKAKIGVSDLNGHASISMNAAVPKVTARLNSNRLDLDELFPDQSQPQLPEQRSAETRKQQKLFSRAPIERSLLQGLDANVSLKIDRLKFQGNVVEKLEGRASLVSGKLTVDHLFATLDEGKLVGKLTFDASKKRPSLRIKADIRELPLGKFLKKADITDALKLTIDAEMDVKGRGESIHAIMASLQGKSKVIGRNGRIDSKFLSGAVSGVSNIIPWFKNEDANKIHCFVSRFDIDKGIADSKVMLLETVGMTVKGDGNIDLGRETLDLTFVPKAKNTSLASFALPMQFKGPINDPKMSANVSKEAIATVGNVVSTVGSVLLGPVGILGSIGLGLVNKKNASRNDPCVKAMGAYSKAKSTQQAAPPRESPGAVPREIPQVTQKPSPEPSKKTDESVADKAKRNVGNVLEGAGEAVKGIGNAFKGLFGGDK